MFGALSLFGGGTPQPALSGTPGGAQVQEVIPTVTANKNAITDTEFNNQTALGLYWKGATVGFIQSAWQSIQQNPLMAAGTAGLGLLASPMGASMAGQGPAAIAGIVLAGLSGMGLVSSIKGIMRDFKDSKTLAEQGDKLLHGDMNPSAANSFFRKSEALYERMGRDSMNGFTSAFSFGWLKQLHIGNVKKLFTGLSDDLNAAGGASAYMKHLRDGSAPGLMGSRRLTQPGTVLDETIGARQFTRQNPSIIPVYRQFKLAEKDTLKLLQQLENRAPNPNELIHRIETNTRLMQSNAKAIKELGLNGQFKGSLPDSIKRNLHDVDQRAAMYLSQAKDSHALNQYAAANPKIGPVIEQARTFERGRAATLLNKLNRTRLDLPERQKLLTELDAESSRLNQSLAQWLKDNPNMPEGIRTLFDRQQATLTRMPLEKVTLRDQVWEASQTPMKAGDYKHPLALIGDRMEDVQALKDRLSAKGTPVPEQLRLLDVLKTYLSEIDTQSQLLNPNHHPKLLENLNQFVKQGETMVTRARETASLTPGRRGNPILLEDLNPDGLAYPSMSASPSASSMATPTGTSGGLNLPTLPNPSAVKANLAPFVKQAAQSGRLTDVGVTAAAMGTVHSNDTARKVERLLQQQTGQTPQTSQNTSVNRSAQNGQMPQSSPNSPTNAPPAFENLKIPVSRADFEKNRGNSTYERMFRPMSVDEEMKRYGKASQ
jgi:hypothetical protein